MENPSPGEKKRDNGDQEDDDQPVFSLITGKYRHAKRYGVGKGASLEICPRCPLTRLDR